MLVLSRFNAMMEMHMRRKHRIRSVHIFMNWPMHSTDFYHETKILSEEDLKVQASYIGLLVLTKNILETCIDVLWFFPHRTVCKSDVLKSHIKHINES